VAPSTIGRIVRGEVDPSCGNIDRIAKALGLSFIQLAEIGQGSEPAAQPTDVDLPDVGPLDELLADASALVNTAYKVVVQGNDSHGVSRVLRFAVQVLEKATEQLDEIACQLARCRKVGEA
jgi:transcriptional regulator with XRE-family HTH domain